MALLECSFCGKFHNEVALLIVGPFEITICNECVFSCVDILKDKGIIKNG